MTVLGHGNDIHFIMDPQSPIFDRSDPPISLFVEQLPFSVDHACNTYLGTIPGMHNRYTLQADMGISCPRAITFQPIKNMIVSAEKHSLHVIFTFPSPHLSYEQKRCLQKICHEHGMQYSYQKVKVPFARSDESILVICT